MDLNQLMAEFEADKRPVFFIEAPAYPDDPDFFSSIGFRRARFLSLGGEDQVPMMMFNAGRDIEFGFKENYKETYRQYIDEAADQPSSASIEATWSHNDAGTISFEASVTNTGDDVWDTARNEAKLIVAVVERKKVVQLDRTTRDYKTLDFDKPVRPGENRSFRRSFDVPIEQADLSNSYLLVWVERNLGTKQLPRWDIADGLMAEEVESSGVGPLHPEIELLSPRPETALYENVPIEFTSDAIDWDGEVVEVAYYVDGLRLCRSVDGPDWSCAESIAFPGSYSLVAQVEDDSGLTKKTSPIEIRIRERSELNQVIFLPLSNNRHQFINR